MLLEDNFGTFVPDRSKMVTESTPSGKQLTRIPGLFSLCDTLNGNNRRYSRKVWEKNLATGSTLQSAISANAAFGLLEHPKDGHVDLLSPIAISTTQVSLNEKGEVVGEITVLGTPEGQRLIALIEGGWNPTVSSRGFGSLVRGTDGVDEVQEDYVCEGWDVVLKPSFVKAIFNAHSKPTSESTAPVAPPAAPSLRESKPSSSPSASQNTQVNQTKKVMSESIKQRLAALRAVDCSKMDPARFAGGLAEMNSLHQEVANYLSEDAKRSWEAQQLHTDISALEQTWTQAAKAPSVQATKLSEDRSKLLQVTSAVVAAADKFRTRLGEAINTIAGQKQLVSAAVTRGKFWRNKCEQLESRLAVLEQRYDVATIALDKLTERYHTDTVPLARRVIQLEFAEQAKTPEIKKALSEATRLKHIVAIRESISKPAAPAAAATPAAAPAPAPATPAATPAPAAPAPAAPAPAAPAANENINTQPFAGARSISESVAVAQRLSRTTAQ